MQKKLKMSQKMKSSNIKCYFLSYRPWGAAQLNLKGELTETGGRAGW